MLLKYNYSDLTFTESELKVEYKNELQQDLKDNETLESRMSEYPFEKWVQDLIDTGDYEIIEN